MLPRRGAQIKIMLCECFANCFNEWMLSVRIDKLAEI
jgi:hypothetical protein